MGWHDAAFQSKNYDTETYKKVQNNSYKIARRSIILLQVGFLIPFALTIVMGFIYTIATFQILDPTEYLSEWLYSMGITFVLCFVPLFWGAIAYARLQIVCQHLGFWLKGAKELSDRGRSVNLGRSVAHAVGAETAEAAYAAETAGLAIFERQWTETDKNKHLQNNSICCEHCNHCSICNGNRKCLQISVS